MIRLQYISSHASGTAHGGHRDSVDSQPRNGNGLSGFYPVGCCASVYRQWRYMHGVGCGHNHLVQIIVNGKGVQPSGCTISRRGVKSATTSTLCPPDLDLIT